MPEDTMNDWPDEIIVDVISPLAYLRTQAGLLGSKTKGLLQGDVTTAVEKGVAFHRLELVGAGLKNARKIILTLSHSETEPYPVDIEADCIQRGNPDIDDLAGVFSEKLSGDGYYLTADSFQEMREVVRMVLRSRHVTVALHSMLALMNDKRMAAAAS